MDSPDVSDDGHGLEAPPPRPTTPPLRRGFVLVFLALGLATTLVYGVPRFIERSGYAWESGRAKAAARALARLDEAGVVSRSSGLFRMATTAVSPAVVNVQSYRDQGGLGVHGLPLGGPQGNGEGSGRELGSGVVIDRENGYVVTNNHVVQGADRIIVRLGKREDVPAKLIGADPKTDLAVLQVKADIQVAAEWGDSEQLDIGDWVLAIGSPLGFDHSVTAGIVSATERNDLRIAEYESFIQTDAAINPGNSGGPLVNLAGKVVGINTAIITQSGGYEGIGLAIPSSLARRIVDSLIKQGRVVRGFLGVAIEPVDVRLAKALGLPDDRGALVNSVTPDSPADRADLKVGDVIVGIDGHEVDGPTSLRYLTAELNVGGAVPLDFYRDGKRRTASVTIGEFPTNPEITPLGFSIKDGLTPDGKGPAVEIDRVVTSGPAFAAGLRPEMKIIAVEKIPVRAVTDFLAVVRNLDLERGLNLVVLAPDGRFGPVTIAGPKAAEDQGEAPGP